MAGLIGKILRDWLTEGQGPPQERLAALVMEEGGLSGDDGPWPTPSSDPFALRGKILYATNPRVAEDPIYLTRMVFHLQALAHSKREDLPLPELGLRNLLNTTVQPGFVAPLPVEVADLDGVFLHDIEWRATDHPDWLWWQPNRGLRRIQLDAQGRLLRILPAAAGDASRYARRRIRLLRSEGAREVTAYLVQANNQLYSGEHSTDEPAAVIFSEDPGALPDDLRMLARRLYDIRDTDETPDELRDALRMLRAGNVGWYYHRRARARTGRPYFVADLFMPREYLKEGRLTGNSFRCLVEPGEAGGIELLPYNMERGPAVAWDPAWAAWNNRTVVRLAHAISEESKYGDLPVLGDALEEAGCTNQEILEHCRAGWPHDHDCWVINGLVALGGRLD